MPNAVHRIKSNQLCKVEKENENKDIKRKFKSFTKPEKFPKVESVWDRLSKVKKSSSNDSTVSNTSKSRHDIRSKSTHRLVTQLRNQTQTKRPVQPNLVPMKRPMERTITSKVVKSPRTVFFPDLTRQNIVYLCEPMKPVVKDIITPRAMSNSKSSSEESKNGNQRKSAIDYMRPRTTAMGGLMGLRDYVESQAEVDLTQDSCDDFEIAPLMPVTTTESVTFSAKIADNFRDLLEQNRRMMAPDEINVIKNVVKTDERYPQLEENDPELFKDILKTKLREILRQETVVQTALNNLDSTPCSARTICPTEVELPPVVKKSAGTVEIETMELPDASSSVKPRVDVIFKNVPTLEKEIIILRALGEKLEATLRRTVTVTTSDPDFVQRRTTATSTSNLHCRVLHECFTAGPIDGVEFILHAKGLLLHLGSIKEFRIANKTLHELKGDSKPFYVPTNERKTELRRTNFRKLKENPNVLLQHVQSKGKSIPFNILDQDPVFFNAFFFGFPSVLTLRNKEEENDSKFDTISNASSDIINFCDGGDGTTRACEPYAVTQEKEPLKIEEINTFCTVPVLVEKKDGTPSKYSYERVSNVLKGAFQHTLQNYKKQKEKAQRDAYLVDGPMENELEEKLSEPQLIEIHELIEEEIIKVEDEEKFNNKISLEARLVAPLRMPIAAPLQKQKRRRIRKTKTPLHPEEDIDPKNHLIKTVLIGAMQISIFLLLVMAITYPDAKC